MQGWTAFKPLIYLKIRAVCLCYRRLDLLRQALLRRIGDATELAWNIGHSRFRGFSRKALFASFLGYVDDHVLRDDGRTLRLLGREISGFAFEVLAGFAE